MRKVLSIFLIYCLIFSVIPVIPVSAAEDCTITFSGTEPAYSIDGTQAYFLNSAVEPTVLTKGGRTGWQLETGIINSPTDNRYDGHSFLYLNMADTFMSNLSGNRDVLLDVTYYDGDSADKGNEFYVAYHSHSLLHELADNVTLGGTGKWLTHTFTLKRPLFRDWQTKANITIGIHSDHMKDYGVEEFGPVIIGAAKVYYGEERKFFTELTSESIGNIFFNNNPISMILNIENPTGTPLDDVTVTYTVTDTRTQEVVLEENDNLYLNGSRTTTHPISFQNLPYSVYKLEALVYDGDKLIDSDITEFSRVHALGESEATSPATNQSMFGINTHITKYSGEIMDDCMYLSSRSGSRFVRISLAWESVEKTAGVFNMPEHIKSFIKESNKNGQEVMIMLGLWNGYAYPDLKPYTQEGNEENFQSFLDAYEGYIRAVVNELKDEIDYWEIYNEYDNGDPAFPDVKFTADDYFQILKRGYAVVKEVDPDSTVIGGAIGGLNPKEIDFIERLYQLGAKDYMDVLSVHEYFSMADSMIDYVDMQISIANQIRTIISNYGGDEKLWLNEFNFLRNAKTTRWNRENQVKHMLKFFIRNNFVGFYDRMYSYMFEAGFYRDNMCISMLARAVDEYGVLPVPLGANLTYLGISFFNKLVACATPISMTQDENDAYICKYYDEKHERPVYVIFNYALPVEKERTSSVTVTEDGVSLTAYDMYGNVIDSGNGSITVTANSSPIYVTGPEKDFLVKQDGATKTVTLRGISATGEKVSAIVLRNGVSGDRFKSSAHQQDEVMYINQCDVSSDGEYSFTFQVTEGTGTYTVLLTSSDGIRTVYYVTYESGKFNVVYRLTQAEETIRSVAELQDGELTVNYNINNPEKKVTDYVLVGAVYKDSRLIKVQCSPLGALTATNADASGSFKIADIDASEVDVIKVFILNNMSSISPLYAAFELN